MKIQKVQSIDVMSSKKGLNSIRHRDQQVTTTRNDVEYSNQPKENVSFRGNVFFTKIIRPKNLSKDAAAKMNELEGNASYYGQKFINEAREIAAKYGLSEITQPVMLLVALLNLKSYFDDLNSGKLSHDDDTTFSTPSSLRMDLVDDVIKNSSKRNKIYPIIDKEIDILTNQLDEGKIINSRKTNSKIPFSKDFLNDIYVSYESLDPELTDKMLFDSILFEEAYTPSNDEIRRSITEPFQMKLKDAILLDDRSVSERTHLSFYDDKALNIWKNLAVNTNMAILHDNETTPDYLVNSILYIFENSKDGFGKLNKDNTIIVNFNDNGELDDNYLGKKFKEFAKNPDKNYVVILDIMDKDIKALDIDETNIDTFLEAPKNVKFVMVADKDKYYASYDGAELKGFFDGFGEITIPLMNMQQAQKAFQEQPLLMSKVKKQLSPQAIDKCVEVANQLKGTYPGKAQKVMELVSAYYVDKDVIDVSDVESYVREAKDLFKPVDKDAAAVKIVLDTGIKIKDMVGSPSTRKEVESIVSSIQDKSIGTKGYIIYSQDGSVGAGRKYTAKAIAGETKSPYIEVNAGDFGTEKVDLFSALFGGEASLSPEASMKKLLSMIKAHAESNPTKSAVVSIEDFEYFSFGENVTEYHKKAMLQLIREMDKAQEQGLNIIVIGSMSNPKYIDSATSKSFKFIDKIEVESPGYDSNARAEIIDYYLDKKNIKLNGSESEQIKTKEHINRLTENASYIEILTLLDKAKHVAKERKHAEITRTDFTEAYLQLEYGRPRSAQDPQYAKDIVTSHECGHALNGIIFEELVRKNNKPSHLGPKINFITLDPRGWFGGCVFTTEQDNPEWSFENIFSNIVCDFGGNSCEKILYNQDGSWGITADMEMATHMATLATSIMIKQEKHKITRK
ncbi:MAG: AAA family ATPase, partial [bacterium]|nr:AAA family ATPase [bacterium]